jgi:hypothetical protein
MRARKTVVNIQLTGLLQIIALFAITFFLTRWVLDYLGKTVSETDAKSPASQARLFLLRMVALVLCPLALTLLLVWVPSVLFAGASESAPSLRRIVDFTYVQLLWAMPSGAFYALVMSWPDRKVSVRRVVTYCFSIAAISLLLATVMGIDRVSDVAGVLAQLVSGILPLSAGSAASGIVVNVSPSGFDADWSTYARPARGLILTMALCVVYVMALSMKWRQRRGASSV